MRIFLGVSLSLLVALLAIAAINIYDFTDLSRQSSRVQDFKIALDHGDLCKGENAGRLVRCVLRHPDAIPLSSLDVTALIQLQGIVREYAIADAENIKVVSDGKKRTAAYNAEEVDFLEFELGLVERLLHLEDSARSAWLSVRLRNHLDRLMSKFQVIELTPMIDGIFARVRKWKDSNREIPVETATRYEALESRYDGLRPELKKNGEMTALSRGLFAQYDKLLKSKQAQTNRRGSEH